jgi:hypothetical protein
MNFFQFLIFGSSRFLKFFIFLSLSLNLRIKKVRSPSIITDSKIVKNDRLKNKKETIKTVQVEKNMPITILKDKRLSKLLFESKNKDSEKPKIIDSRRRIIDNSIIIFY